MAIRRVVVRLHGSLARSGAREEVVVVLRGDEDLSRIAELVGLSRREGLMFMVGGEVVYEDYVPRDGDVIDIYPLSFGG